MKYIFGFLIGILLINCDITIDVEDSLKLKPKLEGRWKASAFTGEIHEEWKLGNDGWMQQEEYYMEATDTSYRAISRIEKVSGDIILFSVIKDNNPKIFKSVNRSTNTITFENTDYKNPFKVKYEFIDSANFVRTITGYEQDSLVSYRFDFVKMN